MEVTIKNKPCFPFIKHSITSSHLKVFEPGMNTQRVKQAIWSLCCIKKVKEQQHIASYPFC